MSFAFLPLYTGDYLRDTRHLSCSEHGVYLLLLMQCWDQRGPLPTDEKKLAAICGARSGDEIEAMRRVISEFFIVMTDGLYNRRMQLEVERASNISAVRSEAGRKGYQAKAKQLLSKSQASASTPTPTPTPTITTTTTNIKTSSAESAQKPRRSAHEPCVGDGDIVAVIPSLKGGVEIRRSFITDLLDAYPNVLVGQEIDRARLWLESNPTRRKSNVRRFLTNWMARKQERGT